ncbi:alpha/beta hydrolase-fold protein [Kordiimonas pumila]|uniref:Alpha/beta hydrolase-fold protein n=1 Tax=Kordiimonas pumila TaxID=2161677 RepID=A0ABV7D530_9PROT|nr:alpha/beta hydrolase-fold protein [Kordiimonas pumila]
MYKKLLILTLVSCFLVGKASNELAAEETTVQGIMFSKTAANTYELLSDQKVFVLGSVSGSDESLDLVVQPTGRTFKLGSEGEYQFAFIAEKSMPHILRITSANSAQAIGIITIDSVIPVSVATPRNEANISLIKSPRMKRLAKDIEDNPEALAAFWQEVQETGTPLIETLGTDKALYTFLWRSENISSVELSWAVWKEDRTENLLAYLPGTDLWFKTLELPVDVAVSYKMAPGVSHLMKSDLASYRRLLNDFLQRDPLNPKYWKGESLFDSSSLLLGPKSKPLNWSIKKDNVPEGSIEHLQVKSGIMQNEREIALYRPAYAKGRSDIPLLFVFDGKRYLEDAATATTLDNLIAEGKIPPVAAVFVYNTVPTTRSVELPCNPNFVDFLADELLPVARASLPEAADSKAIITAGSSFGGLASTCANYFRPETFKYVLSMSGAYWWSPAEGSPLFDEDSPAWALRAVAKNDCLADAYYFDAGALETGYGLSSIADASEALSAILKAKNCTTTYRTFSGGHDRYHWRETIAEGLIWLLSGEETWITKK